MRNKIAVAIAAVGLSAPTAQAQEIKIGLPLPLTGIGAEHGHQVKRGVDLYLKLHVGLVEPYKVTLIARDVKDPGGATARTVVQELITQDKVDLLIGWVYSPNAIASAPVITAGNKLGIIVNAATAHITTLSPNFIRPSFSTWQAGYALGEAAAKTLGAKTAVIGFSDFPPGRDSRDSFKRSFEANGGKILDEIPMGGAASVPDFTPFFQRAKDRKPDVFFVFVPAGEHSSAVVKVFSALGMREARIKLIGTGDITQDSKLQAMGPAAVGLITMHHYHADLDNPENRKFVAAWKQAYGADNIPDFVAVGAYDSMAAAVHVMRALKGRIDTAKAVEVLKGWTHQSPRGPIKIDPDTRDVVLNEYLSEVATANGRLVQKTLATIEAVKDPCKELKIGPCGAR